MSILEELYYGNITPGEQGVELDDQCEKILQHICRHEEALKETLTEKQKELFKKFQDSTMELQCKNELATFITGFKLGAQITAEALFEK